MDEYRSVSAREDYVRHEPAAATPPTVPAPPQESGANSRLFRLLLVLAALLAIVLLPSLVQRVQYANTIGKERAKVEVAIEGLRELDKLSLAGLSEASRLIAQRVGPSVVYIQTRRAMNGRGGDEWSFLVPGRRSVEGQGSGVIVDSEGYVVTNHHVIVGATEIRINLSDERQVAARVVGADVLTDIAVLKIDVEDLIAAPWGESAQLEVGDLVWAVGSPFGLDRSVTFGIVSAKGRAGASGPHQSFLQSDAAVNPGNSGGPLINVRGEIVGINTAIIGQAYQGISFSIPSRLARDVYEKLRSTGKVARGWLGVRLLDITPEVAERLGLETTDGVLVAPGGVIEGSPADRAGIEGGDVIIAWDGVAATDSAALSRLVASTEVGSQAAVKVLRGGAELLLEVQVDERPAQL